MKPAGTHAVVPLLAALVAGGCATSRAPAGSSASVLPEADAAAYDELASTVQAWYAEDVPGPRLAYASIRGLLSGLDPHSTFLDPEDYGFLKEGLRSAIYGIGVIISQQDGVLSVLRPFEGSPADCAGVEAGDVLEKIDDLATFRVPIEDSMRALKGPAGTWVRVTVRRPGVPQPFDRNIRRAEIPVRVVPEALLLAPGTGYIRLIAFSDTTASEVAGGMRALERLGMRRLVLDLRDNFGGLLSQARATAELFLAKDERLYSIRSASEEGSRATCTGASWYPPLVVLVGRETASSAEVLVGALQDHDRALVVGVPTYGKGLVQNLFDLRDGSGLKLTTAKYYTPSGRCLQRDYTDRLAYGSLEEGRPGDHEDEATLAYDAGDFRTDGGRGLPANGGVVPDVVVRAASPSGFLAALSSRELFFEFAVATRARLGRVPAAPEIGDELKTAFFRLVDSKADLPFAGRARETYAAEKDKAAVDRALREAFASLAEGPEAGARVRLEGDAQLAEALRRFRDAARLAAEYEERVGARRRPPGE